MVKTFVDFWPAIIVNKCFFLRLFRYILTTFVKVVRVELIQDHNYLKFAVFSTFANLINHKKAFSPESLGHN